MDKTRFRDWVDAICLVIIAFAVCRTQIQLERLKQRVDASGIQTVEPPLAR